VLICVGQQGKEACASDRELQLALIVRARPGDAARNDLAGFSDIALERREILVVDLLDVICREPAKLLATEKNVPCLLSLPHAHGHVIVVAIVAEVIVTTGILIGRSRHGRGFGDRLVHLDHETAQYGIAEAK